MVDQDYSLGEAAISMSVGKSNMDKWVRQLRNERQGTSHHPTAITADQRKIKELNKTIKRIEIEKFILKKTNTFLMSHSMNSFC
ncbi:MAG: transposase-like protein [Polaribacter sp.]